MMQMTISVHNGTKLSQEHNRRDQRHTSKDGHIDTTKSEENIILVDMDIHDAYEQIFGDAVKDYNDRQKRKDRKIPDYFEKVKNDKQRNIAYETIFQIGNEGNHVDVDTAIEILTRHFYEWGDRNPNLYVIGAYIHVDEASVHMHVDYIPVAMYDKGLKLQNCLHKALEQQGHEGQSARKTAQMAWQESERASLTEICKDFDIEVVKSKDQKRKHLETSEFKKYRDEVRQAREHADSEIADAKKRLKGIQDNMNQEYKELMSEVEEYREEAERQKDAYNSMAKEYSVKLDTDKAVLEVLSAVKLNKNGDLPTCAKVRRGFRGKYVKMPYDEAVFLTNAHKRGMDELKKQTDRFATTMSYETIIELLDINKELKQELDSTRHEVEQKQMEIDDMIEAVQMLPEKVKKQFYKRLDIVRGIENGAQAIDRIVQQQVGYDRER